MKKIKLLAMGLLVSIALTACGPENIPESVTSGAADLSQKVNDKYQDAKGQVESKAGELVDKAGDKLLEEVKVADGKYEEVYKEYVAKLEEQYKTFDKELKDEVAAGKKVKDIAGDCKVKMSGFADTYKDGMKSFGKVFAKYPYTSDLFKEWADKLNEECVSYGKKLGTSYMEGAADYLKGLLTVDWTEFGMKDK